MESPRNSQPSRKHATDSKLQGGNIIVPGTEYSSPLIDPPKKENIGGDDKAKGNLAEIASNKDGNTAVKK